jgi:signal transduction histidine kinase
MEALPFGIVLLDESGLIVAANSAAAGWAATPESLIPGADFFRAGIPDVQTVISADRYRTQIIETGEEIRATVVTSSSQRGEQLLVSVRRILGIEGVEAVVVLEDHSEVARERERRERAERLAAVGAVAAGVAHEVNNPLASIKSFAQLLARDATRPEQREALELIITESTRVAGIVENLLSYSRQQGAAGVEPVNLSAIAERVLHTQQYALATAGISVRRDFDRSVSPVMGEAGALQQVVLNLVVNAEEALAGKDGDRKLIIRTRESTEGVILAVVDNGPGISRELLPVIFERFRTTKPGGTGLGLAISASIIRDHSGQIWAESDEGKGAAFLMRLPRATDSLLQTRTPASAPSETIAATRRLRILVADDEAALRRALSMFLERRGHHVLQAGDAHEAFKLAESQPVDVALVDARMPGDGLALLERLEALPGLRGRTALMTGDIGRARTRQGIATGRPYLSKPFDMDDMVKLLETLAG